MLWVICDVESGLKFFSEGLYDDFAEVGFDEAILADFFSFRDCLSSLLVCFAIDLPIYVLWEGKTSYVVYEWLHDLCYVLKMI